MAAPHAKYGESTIVDVVRIVVDSDFAFVHNDLKEGGLISFNPSFQMEKACRSQIGNARLIRGRDIDCDDPPITLQR
ncbi:hypothetical protein ADM96_12940 [Burkholderia sp. ST111]|nr:hypothetical protein ADM96_12940 [Burkholderia sp. ST111]